MNHISITERSGNVWRADAFPGSHVASACEEAIQVATTENVTVVFDFNGVEISATKNDLASTLAERFSAECDRRAKAWRESEAGQKYEAEQRQRLAERQSAIEGLLTEFDAIAGVEAQLVGWVGRFAELNDHVGLSLDKAALASKLEAAGYRENAEVGKPPEEIQADKSKMARYIVGQAINNLRHGMPIHPIASKFAADYASA